MEPRDFIEEETVACPNLFCSYFHCKTVNKALKNRFETNFEINRGLMREDVTVDVHNPCFPIADPSNLGALAPQIWEIFQ
jgi:hypothetical protein